MSTIVTRAGKGSPLTHTEVDTNFTNLNTDKLQSGDTASSLVITSADINGGSIDGTTIGASTASTGAFTSLTSSSTTTLNGTTIPSSKTLVVTTDIGSTVQAYDADTAKLDVSQNWSASQSFNAGVTLGDASGDALTINSSAASIPNGLNFDSNTLVIDAANNNVGIGTASPAAKLDVITGTNSGLRVSDGTYTGTFVPSSLGGMAITTGGAYPLIYYINGAERMRIDSLGQLGIGTSSPGYRLDVAAGDTTAGLGYAARLRSNSTAGAASLQFTNNGVTAQNAYITADDSQNLTLASGTGYTRLWTNGTERMRIDSSGNVCIGATSAGQKLQISNSSSSGFAAMRMAANARSYDVGVGGSASGFQQNNWYVYDVTGAATRLVIDSSGRVTMPFQPAFHATRDTAYNANGTVVVFPDVSVNIGSGYNSSNGRFTAPVAGTYIILVSFFTNITNAPIDFRITVNGGAVGGNATTGTTSVARDCHAYIIRTVSANDYIEVISQGFGMNIPGGLGIFQTFSGHLIG
jgi:hypothetical protein